MRIIAFIVCGVLWCAHASAQHQQTIDSLKQQLAKTPLHEQLETLNNISWAYRKVAPDSTILYAKKAYQLAEQINDYKGSCKALSFIGIGYNYLTQLDSALVYYKKSLRLAEVHKDSIEIAYGYNNIGTFYHSQLDFSNAYRYQEMALNIFERLKDEIGMAYAYQGLARTSLAKGDINDAIEFSSYAIDIRKNTGTISATYVTSLIEMAQLYSKKEDYVQAHHTLQDARKYSVQLDDEVLKAICDRCLSEIYIAQELYTEALVYAKRAVARQNHITNPYEKYKSYLVLGSAYLHSNDTEIDKAEKYLMLCLNNATEHSIADLEVESCKLLADLYEKNKSYAKSLAFYKRYLVAKEAIFNKEKADEMNRLHQNVAMMRKEQELEKMRQREHRRDIAIKEERNKTLFLVALASISIIVAFLFGRINRKQKHINQQLSEQKQRIEEQHTAIQQKNEILEQTNIQLSEINREKDSLMGVVAHDLKAPLNKVKGYTQILKLLGGMSEEQQKIVEGIDKVVENGANLIRDLLDVHAIEYAESHLQPQDLNMSELLADLVEGYEQAAEQKSINLIYTDPGHAVPIYSDEASLIRVFDNLISNAVKFSPQDKSVFISLHDNDSQIQVMIRDEGQGFSAEDQAKAFRKFQRLSARPTGGESSTGLGLAIVKVLVEKLQGSIQLYSEPDKGSEFIIELPTSVSL